MSTYTALPPELVSLAPELVLGFRRLLHATARGRVLCRWENTFERALEGADAEALGVVHSYVNNLYGRGRNRPAQGLINVVEREIARYWEAG